MADPGLRQRLMDAMDRAGNQWFDSYDGEADAALAVFAAWLRERADEDPNEGTPITLRRLADEIDPKGDGNVVVA